MGRELCSPFRAVFLFGRGFDPYAPAYGYHCLALLRAKEDRKQDSNRETCRVETQPMENGRPVPTYNLESHPDGGILIEAALVLPRFRFAPRDCPQKFPHVVLGMILIAGSRGLFEGR